MDREELELFEKSLRHATATASGAALDAALAELGWADALTTDPRAAVSLLFELQGGAATTSGALDLVLADALGLAPGAGVVLPPLRSWQPPAEWVGEEVRIAGLGLPDLASGATAVAVASDGGAITIDINHLAGRELRGLDPHLGLVEVTAALPRATTRSTPSTAWEDAIVAGQRALAHELVGATRAMLELARTHALERVQFGRPIAGFQAVRHRLADALVAAESASAALDAAWDDPSPFTASLAKAVAGRSARTVARHCQQVLAGIGFTADHPFHHYLRRILVLDALLGDARSLTKSLGEQLLQTRQLPAILPL